MYITYLHKEEGINIFEDCEREFSVVCEEILDNNGPINLYFRHGFNMY